MANGLSQYIKYYSLRSGDLFSRIFAAPAVEQCGSAGGFVLTRTHWMRRLPAVKDPISDKRDNLCSFESMGEGGVRAASVVSVRLSGRVINHPTEAGGGRLPGPHSGAQPLLHDAQLGKPSHSQTEPWHKTQLHTNFLLGLDFFFQAKDRRIDILLFIL